jgi:O-antigen/teichoic acid export membrane protein
MIEHKLYLMKSIGSGYIKTLISIFATVIFLPLLITNIGMNGFGIVAFISLGVNLSVLFDFGVSKSAVHFVSKNSLGSIKAILIVLIFLAFLTLFLGIFFYLFDEVIFSIVYEDMVFNSNLILFTILIFVTNILLGFFRGLLEGGRFLHKVNIGFVVFSMVNLPGLCLITSYTSNSNYWAGWIFISYFIILIIHIIQSKSLIFRSLRSHSNFKDFYNYSRPVYGANIITSGFMPFVKSIVVIFSPTTAMLGVFELGVRISMLSNSLLSVLATPYLTLFTERKNEFGQFAIAIDIVKKSFLLYLLGLILFYFIGEHTLNLISNNSTEAFYPSLLLIGGMCLNGVMESIYRYNLANCRFFNLYISKASAYFWFCVLFCYVFTFDSNLGYVIQVSISYFISQLATSIILLYLSVNYEKKQNLF